MQNDTALPILDRSSMLYRLAPYDNYVNKQTGKLTLKAFMLRSATSRDPLERTLSLIIKGTCSLEYVWNNILNPCYGVGELNRGQVLDFNQSQEAREFGVTLDVVVDNKPEEELKIWACITGLPHKEENKVAALRMADLLSRIAEPIPPP